LARFGSAGVFDRLAKRLKAWPVGGVDKRVPGHQQQSQRPLNNLEARKRSKAKVEEQMLQWWRLKVGFVGGNNEAVASVLGDDTYFECNHRNLQAV
jgi:hypothetical protein